MTMSLIADNLFLKKKFVIIKSWLIKVLQFFIL